MASVGRITTPSQSALEAAGLFFKRQSFAAKEAPFRPIPGCAVGNVPIDSTATTSGESRAAGKHAGRLRGDAGHLTVEIVEESHGSCCPRTRNASRDHCGLA